MYLKAYQTVAEARAGISAYLEFYKRPHQALSYRTSAEVYQDDQQGRELPGQEAELPSEVVIPSAKSPSLTDVQRLVEGAEKAEDKTLSTTFALLGNDVMGTRWSKRGAECDGIVRE